MNLELQSHEVHDLKKITQDLVVAARQDGEDIRALARIAEIHEGV